MKLSRDPVEDMLGTFILGVFGVVCLALAGSFIALCYFYPRTIFYAMGTFMFTYAVGWCIAHYEEFRLLLHLYSGAREDKIKLPSYGVPVLDKMQQLENKYSISTVKFMAFVHDGVIPFKMDNLDYLEWISLVNELPLINAECGEGED
jgi:hypothetical protein